MADIDTSWVDIIALSDLKADVITPVSLGETPLVLVRQGDDVNAFGGKCPHKGASLDQGTLCRNARDESVIVCPWHKAVFCAANGHLLEPLALDPLPKYPVEIKDGRVLVGSAPRETPAPSAMREGETVAIVGSGAAGVTAVVTLRQLGFAGRIVMLSLDTDLPYDRTALSKTVLASAPGDAKIPQLRPAEFYDAQKIERICDSVTHIEVSTRTLFLRDGEPFQADHILLASGSRPKKLELPGADLPGVHVLRTAEDARAIIEKVGPDSSAVVIGTNFIALEAAAALRKRGVGVTVVSRSNAPFESKFGREIGLRMRALHEKNGVAFIPDCAVQQIIGNGKVERVMLDDETILNADVIITGVGVEPVIAYIEDHYRADDGGVEVDAQMRVAPGVYAAGDIASFPHGIGRVRIEHWRTAQCQARIVARTMLGLPVENLPVPWFWTQQYDQKLEYVGWPDRFDAVDIEGDLEGFDFLARLKKGGKTIGMVASKRAKVIGKAAVDFDAA